MSDSDPQGVPDTAPAVDTVTSLDDVAKARAYDRAVQAVAEELLGPFGEEAYEEGAEAAYRDILQALSEERASAERLSLGTEDHQP